MTALLAHSGADHATMSVVATVAVATYGMAALRVPGWDRRRTVAWAAGVGIVLVASLPTMESAAERSFTGHMVQHLLVIVLAAPLLVLARPLRLAMRAGWISESSGGRTVARLWHRAGPMLAPAAFVVVLFATHLTSIYDDALGNRLLHEGEHAAYLVVAVAVWAAVLGPGRSGVGRVAVAFGVSAGGALLGIILLSANEPLIPTYEARLGTAEAISDQRAAAALMWVSGMLTTVPLLLIAFWGWIAKEQQRTRRAEALVDAASRSNHQPI